MGCHEYGWEAGAWSRIPPTRRAVVRHASDAGRRERGTPPTASHSLTIRLEIQNQPGMLGKVTSAIGKAGGDIGAIDLVEVRKKTIIRDLTFKASDERHGQQGVERLKAIEGIKVVHVSDR